jgi:hypothetical protein
MVHIRLQRVHLRGAQPAADPTVRGDVVVLVQLQSSTPRTNSLRETASVPQAACHQHPKAVVLAHTFIDEPYNRTGFTLAANSIPEVRLTMDLRHPLGCSIALDSLQDWKHEPTSTTVNTLAHSMQHTACSMQLDRISQLHDNTQAHGMQLNVLLKPLPTFGCVAAACRHSPCSCYPCLGSH